MGLDKDVSLTGMQNSILNQMNQMAEKLQKKGEEAGEAIGEGFKEGVKKSAKAIEASSSVVSDAFDDVAGDIKKGEEKLAASLNVDKLTKKVKGLFNELKSIGRGNTIDGEFLLFQGDFSIADLKKRISLLKEIRNIGASMSDTDSNFLDKFFGDYGLDNVKEAFRISKEYLRLLNKSGLQDTSDLFNRRNSFAQEMRKGRNSNFNINIKDEQAYKEGIEQLSNFVNQRRALLKRLDDDDISSVFTDSELKMYRKRMEQEISAYMDNITELQNARKEYEATMKAPIISRQDSGEFKSSMEQNKQALKEFMDLWRQLQDESGDSESFAKRYAHLMEAVSGKKPKMSAADAYEELLQKEREYQAALKEEQRINRERNEQLQEFVRLSANILPEGQRTGKSGAIYSQILNQITQEGLSASQAIEKLEGHIKELHTEKVAKELQKFRDTAILEDKEFASLPETKQKFQALFEEIENGSKTAAAAIKELSQMYKNWADSSVGNAKLKEQLNLSNLSRKELGAAFKSVDLSGLLKSLNIKQAELPEFKRLFTELLQLDKAAQDGAESIDKVENKFNEIVRTFLDLGSVVETVESQYGDFLKFMSGKKIAFSASDKAEFGDDWNSILKQFPGLLTSKAGGGVSYADQLYKELSEQFKNLFPEDIIAKQDQLRKILDVLAAARLEKKTGGKIERSLDQSSIEDLVGQLFQKMLVGIESTKKQVGTSKPAEKQKESENLDAVAKSAEKAAEAKKQLAQATDEAAEAARKAAERTKQEKEQLEDATGSIISYGEAHDKIKTIYGADGNIAAKTVTDSRTRAKSIETESKYYTYKDGEETLEATQIVQDFRKRAEQLKKESAKIELAQKTLDKFLSQFANKTAGQASTINGYNALSKFKISNLDNIEEAVQKMIALDAEYNKVTQNFRMGTKSMNPFVNAVNGAVEMKDKISQVTMSFDELSEKPEDLKTKVDGLNNKLAEMKKHAKFGEDGKLIEITDIYGFSKAYGELNAEIKAVNSSIRTQRQEQKAQAQEYATLEKLQNKLYSAKTRLATSSYTADDLDAQEARIKRLESQLSQKLSGVKYDDNRVKILEREKTLQKDIDSIITRRMQREMDLSYKQDAKDRLAEQKRLSVEQSKDEAARAKEQARIAAERKAQIAEEKKIVDAFFNDQEAKLKELNALYEKQAQSAANMVKYRAQLASGTLGKEDTRRVFEKIQVERETQKELQRQVQSYGYLYEVSAQQLVIEEKRQKAISDAADAQAHLTDAQTKADNKAKTSQKQKELNALYSERRQILSEILDYTKQLNKATNEATKKAAQQALDSAAARLNAKNAEIYKYGSLVDPLKLQQQDSVLTEGLRKFNWDSYIAGAAPKNTSYENLLVLQEKIYDIKKKLIGVDKESSDGQKLSRHLAILEEEYNTSSKLLSIEEQRLLIQNRYNLEKELNTARKEYQDQETKKQEAKQLEDLLKLYKQYADAREKVARIDNDASGKVADATRAQAVQDMANAAKQLRDKYKVDVSSEDNLFDSLSKNNILTQEQMNELLSEDIKRRGQINDLIREASDAEATRAKKEQERINKQNQNYGKSRFNAETRNYDNIMAHVRSIESESGGLNEVFQQKINEYEAAYRRLEGLRKIFAEDPKAIENKELTKQFQDAAFQAEKLRKGIQGILKDSDKLSQISDDEIFARGDWNVSKFDKAKDAMKAFADEMSNGTFKLKGFNQAGTEMYGTFVSSSGAFENLTVKINEATGEMIAFRTASKGIPSVWESTKTSIINGAKHLARIYFSFYDIIRYLRRGYQSVKQIDDAMTELKKVTDETVASYKEFERTASAVSKEIGTTMSAFISSAADWARLGYDLKEATELAKNTSVLMNVSEFEDINKATDTMISALQAFKKEGTDVIDLSQQILDAYNEVGNNYAISTADLADSLTRSSAALVAAGNSLSEAIALTGAANTTIQNPETVGTALKTLSMRLRGTSVEEITEAGEETDGLISSTSKLAAKIQELTSIDGSGGIKILTESGDFKSTYQILLEIAQVWHDIDDMDQAALLEVIAGKRAGSVVASILNDAQLLSDIFESAENSANSAIDELQVHLDSIEGKVQILTNSMQTMWNNFMKSEVIKFIADLLIKLVDFVNVFGLLPVALGTIGVVKTFKQTYGKNKEKVLTTSITNAITTGFDKVAAAQKAKSATGATTSTKKAPSATTNSSVTGASTTMSTTVVNELTKQKQATDSLNASQAALNSTTAEGTAIKAASTAAENADTAAETSNIAATNASAAAENVDTAATATNTGVQTASTAAENTNTGATNLNTVAKIKNAAASAWATVKTIALTAATAALNMAVMLVVGALINGLINALINAGQAMEDLKTEAINSADALKENRKAVSSYKNEIEELRATLASNTASEEDAYNARVRLMEIQDELIDKYGYEAKGINLVTGAIQDQIEKMNALDVSAARDYVTEYSKAFDDAKRNVEKETASTLNLSGITDNDFKQAYKEKLAELGLVDTSYQTNDGTVLYNVEQFGIKGTRQEIADTYDEIVDWIYEYAETHPIDTSIYIDQISENISDLGLNDEDYKKDLDVYNNFLDNKAISDYTDVYGNILDAQGKYQDALIKGDVEAQEEHRKALVGFFDEADKASANDESMNKYFANMKAEYEKEWAQLDFSLDIKDKNKKMLNIDGEDVEVDVKSIAKSIKKEFDSEGLVADDILNIGKLLTAEEGGQEVDWGEYTSGQIETYKELAAAADFYGLEVEDLIEVLNRLGYIKYSPNAVELTNVGKTVDMLSSSMEKYQSAMEISKELTYDNMQMSQEYYTALTDYLGDSAELRKAIYTENGEYIVTNIELLEDLIKKKQKEQAADVKLSRAQARLRYYDLYKQMRNLTKGQNKLTGSALDEVDALYEQMGSIEKTIAKYSLLETKLLGVTNAYTDLELAQAADEETDFGSKAETMVNALAEAFNTAELGTEAAQVAIAGLIPDDVIDKTKTLDEQMKQIHTYFTKGQLSKLFKVEYDDDGEIESVEMTKEKIEGFVKTLTKTDLGDGLGTVFEGTWDEFTLNPAITSLEQFAEACGLTEEVAFAFLTSLERYDISWLGEDFSTLLDQLMGDDLDYQLYDKTQKLADLEYKIAHGTITKDEQQTYGTLIGEMETLEEQALTTVSRYGELSSKLDATKQEMIDLNEQLAETEQGTQAYEELQGKISSAQEEAADLVSELEKVGGQPTEFTLQVALDEANEQIDAFKNGIAQWSKDNGKNSVKINAVINEIDSNSFEDIGLTKNANGTWDGRANIKGYTELDAESQQKVTEYINLIDSKHTIDAMMGEGITTIEQHLEKIVTILEKTYELSVEAKVDDSEVTSFTDWLKNSTFAKTVTFTAKKIGDSFNDLILGGFGSVNGTAHASGTAHANGNWGAPKTEEALVGELGPEMRVRGSRWELIGQNGAEFTDVRKGDIIFNHKQTEDLLSHGYINGRGKAYAHGTSGTAYALERGSGAIGVSFTNEYYKELQKAKVLEKKLEEIDKKASTNLNLTNDYYKAKNELSQFNSKVQAAQAKINTWDDAYKAKINTYDDKAKGSGSGSGSDKDDSEQLIDFIEIKLEEIEAIISKTTAKLENYVDDTSTLDEKNDAYDKLVEAEKNKASTYFEAAEYYNKKAAELLEKVPKEYREKAKNGAIEIKNFIGESQGEIAEAIQEYRDMATKADDAEVGYLEAIAQQAAYRVEQLEDIASDFENIVSLIETEGSIIEAQMDLVEASGERLSPKYYEALIENSQETIETLKDQKAAMQKEFNSAVKSGDIKKGSDEWYEMANSIASVDEQIIQCQVDIEEFQNAILDLKWDNLEKLINRFDALDSELSHIQERLTDNEYEIVDDDGNWTDKGIAAIGTLVQQMEIAQYKVEEYGKAIDELNEDYNNGLYSTDEYNEKIAELKENQWDSIEAYEDAEDAIVDLTKTRIDAIKDGIEEEIDAYKELIDKKKEALDADKDLYDFEKQVTEQKKDISEIERQLASLSGDTSTSAMAKKKQLEAELAELKAELEDTYRDRSIEKQKEAYDNEYESYEKRRNDEIEGYDKYLEDPDTVVEDAITALKNRLKIDADVVLSEIEAISDKYGIEISNAIVNPWEDGANAITDYKDSFKDLSDSFSEELDKIIAQEEALQKAADKAAAAALKTIDSNMDNVTKAKKSKSSNSDKDDVEFSLIDSKADSASGMVSSISGNIKYGQKGANVEKLQTALNELGYDCGNVDGVFGDKTLKAVKKFQSSSGYGGAISADGIVGTNTKKKFKAAGYKDGTTGVNNDQFAWIDEIGEELVLHAGANGKLTYLTKGTSVIPADLTEKLLNLAVDPTQTLENSRPIINAPHITNNEINISMEFGEVVHIDTVTNDTLPDLTKAVEKQMDKYMKNLNNQIRKYSR